MFYHLFSVGAPEAFTLDVLVSLLRQENAVDICVIKVPEQIKYTEYFLVVSGVSTRHIRAMALYALKVVTNMRLLIISGSSMCNVCLLYKYPNALCSLVQISKEKWSSVCQD